ncbi:hypothetical protein ABBQ38_009417 [Trebouxia sp. C0009 RCD-2024]
MHQLPVSVQRLVSAVGQKACFSVNFFWEVAQAVHQTPPAVDYTRFAVLVIADLADMKATPRMQILSLYDRVMIWLDKANLGVCVQTNSWTAAALQLAIQFYKVSAPQSLLTTHFGIPAESLDQKARCVKGMLTAAADRPHASNISWSDAIWALLLSSEPPQPEQRPSQADCKQPASVLELVPPDDMAALHAAEAASPISTMAPPAMACKQEQPVVTPAGGAEGPLPAGDDAATAAIDAATAADDAATASAHEVASGSGEGDADQEASACHLLLPTRPAAAAAAARRSQVHSPPCNSERAGIAAHGAAEQLADSSRAAQACKAQNHQIPEASAAPLPVAQQPADQPLVSQLPAFQPRHGVSPSPHQSSEASTRRRITASSGRGATTGTPDVLRRGQPTQLAFSSVHPPPLVPIQGVSLPVTGRLLPQLLPAAASSVHINKLPASSREEAQMLQTQLLHVAQPSCKVFTAPDATQPGSTALLASHIQGEHAQRNPMFIVNTATAAWYHAGARTPTSAAAAGSHLSDNGAAAATAVATAAWSRQPEAAHPAAAARDNTLAKRDAGSANVVPSLTAQRCTHIP